MQTKFSAYYRRVFNRIWKDLKKDLWGLVGAIVVAIAVAILQSRYGFIKPDQTWTAAIVNASPVAAVLLLYLLIHAVRAPWKIHGESAEEHAQDLAKATEKLSSAIVELSIEQNAHGKTQLALESERESLEGAPKVLVSCFDPPDKRLHVHNIGAEALNVQLVPSESPKYYLKSEVLRRLLNEEKATLELQAERKVGKGSPVLERFAGAHLFFSDCQPSYEGSSIQEMLNHAAAQMIDLDNYKDMEVTYTDLSGTKKYCTYIRINWSPLEDGFSDVEVKGIRRCPSGGNPA